ncbi:predicted protein [Histoplasma mississippiense (nom. inval.)]|uniref:predicted protein n=1 Tax=Ajellomyces capsulatus (strain NAm1 / WU24) TaxID=2059318 RepID=UPI000157B79A|nr:predicted protein [Histoplasma mississippiense (nom. inval.)]EDN03454.1 predicted protein [Histoplasma mississippiense (nom. inval.)]
MAAAQQAGGAPPSGYPGGPPPVGGAPRPGAYRVVLIDPMGIASLAKPSSTRRILARKQQFHRQR